MKKEIFPLVLLWVRVVGWTVFEKMWKFERLCNPELWLVFSKKSVKKMSKEDIQSYDFWFESGFCLPIVETIDHLQVEK
jgi:hypothetical protein